MSMTHQPADRKSEIEQKLADTLGYTGDTNVQGEHVQKLDMIANDTLIVSLRRRGHCGDFCGRCDERGSARCGQHLA